MLRKCPLALDFQQLNSNGVGGQLATGAGNGMTTRINRVPWSWSVRQRQQLWGRISLRNIHRGEGSRRVLSCRPAVVAMGARGVWTRTLSPHTRVPLQQRERCGAREGDGFCWGWEE